MTTYTATPLPPRPSRRFRVTRRGFLKTLAGAVLAGAGTYAYGSLIESHRLVVEQVTIPIAGLAAARHGCRIVQLSDLHSGRTALSHIERSLAMALDLKPDFLVITGDFVDSEHADVDALCRVLRKITPRVETLGITGNHDFGAGFANSAFADQTCASLAGAGIRMLRNEIYHPHAGPGELCFAGLDDFWSRRFRPAILQETPADASLIVLSHNPDSFETLDAYRFHLMLSGHTHGGQVRVPFYGPLIMPVRHMERPSGLFHPSATHPEKALYISRGVGHVLRSRLVCPPEVTLITLQNPAMV